MRTILPPRMASEARSPDPRFGRSAPRRPASAATARRYPHPAPTPQDSVRKRRMPPPVPYGTCRGAAVPAGRAGRPPAGKPRLKARLRVGSESGRNSGSFRNSNTANAAARKALYAASGSRSAAHTARGCHARPQVERHQKIREKFSLGCVKQLFRRPGMFFSTSAPSRFLTPVVGSRMVPSVKAWDRAIIIRSKSRE